MKLIERVTNLQKCFSLLGKAANYQEAIKWRRPRLVFDRDSKCEHKQERCQERSDKTDPNQNIFKQGQQQIRWQKDAHKIIFCSNASQTVCKYKSQIIFMSLLFARLLCKFQ